MRLASWVFTAIAVFGAVLDIPWIAALALIAALLLAYLANRR